ncbi:MAG: L-fuculokinase [Bacteroidales bacterium]|jgi:L-fuculokinase|nr:L-fuculokinase [Bacteroidales bacterium]
MEKRDIAIVFDCGATNVRAVAIDGNGTALAFDSYPNNTCPDPFYSAYRIWDINEIWEKICKAAQRVIAKIPVSRIVGVTVTSFGVDGTLFDESGNALYPVISWQCERTVPIMANIEKYIPLQDLYMECGISPISFNTINKLIWFSEHKPELVEKSSIFLMIPSIFGYFLTGQMANDMTMAGTTMTTSLAGRKYSENIFKRINFPIEKMGTPVESGSIIGTVSAKASEETSIPKGIPVIAAGHDTQFAIFGSGAGINQPVLSSGTWEILMTRSENFSTGKKQLDLGITTELDSCSELYNIGNQWIASGMLEWARKILYSDIVGNVYQAMETGAEKVPAGSNGVRVDPSFYELHNGMPGGKITGLTMETTRHEIYRAMLEALSEKLAEGKKALEEAGGFKTDSIICVGGGSKNRLWNQLRANATGVPIKVIGHKETTVLGASFFVQAACGNFSSPEAARDTIEYSAEVFLPE